MASKPKVRFKIDPKFDPAKLPKELRETLLAQVEWLDRFEREVVIPVVTGAAVKALGWDASPDGVVHLKGFRMVQTFVHAHAVILKLHGRAESARKIAKVWLLALEHTVKENGRLPDGSRAEDYRAALEQIGLRRWWYLQADGGAHDGPQYATDMHGLERDLTSGTMGVSLKVLDDTRGALGGEVEEAFRELSKFIREDWEPRNKALSEGWFGKGSAPYLYGQSLAHSVNAKRLYYRGLHLVFGDAAFKRSADELAAFQREMWETFTAPDKRTGLTFCHGVNGLRKVKKQEAYEGYHNSVYLRENLGHAVMDSILGGGLYGPEELAQFGTTLYWCLPVDGPDAGAFAYDFGGGGAKDRGRIYFRDGSSVPGRYEVGGAGNRQGVHTFQAGLSHLVAPYADLPGFEAELKRLHQRATHDRGGLLAALHLYAARRAGLSLEA